MANASPGPPGPNLLAGETAAGEVRFARSGTSRAEPFDAVDSLARSLDRREFLFDRRADRLVLTASGFEVAPVVLAVHPWSDGRCHTVSVTRVRHPRLIPGGLYEYQHADARLVAAALADGCRQWIDTDLDPLTDAAADEPSRCSAMDIEVPATAGRPAHHRRIVYGPVDIRSSSADPPRPIVDADGHPFCGCCLLTHSMDALQQHVEGQATVGIRLFAARLSDGSVGADCRVNGDDFDPGRAALRRYVRTWPGRVPQTRKQYVVITSVPTPTEAE